MAAALGPDGNMCINISLVMHHIISLMSLRILLLGASRLRPLHRHRSSPKIAPSCQPLYWVPVLPWRYLYPIRSCTRV